MSGEAGELAAATEAYEEALVPGTARLVDDYGETPQSLRDLSVSWADRRCPARGLGTGGRDGSVRGSPYLRRRLVDDYGETPQSLRDLSVSLGRIGDVRREPGHWRPRRKHMRNLSFCAAAGGRLRRDAAALRDLSVSLGGSAMSGAEAGELAAATEAHEESLVLLRRTEGPTCFREVDHSLLWPSCEVSIVCCPARRLDDDRRGSKLLSFDSERSNGNAER